MSEILIFGGTTEGKKAAAALDAEGLRYLYSTKTKTDFQPSEFCKYIYGAMDENSLPYFIKTNKIKLIIDAAHPFAVCLHETVAETSEETGVPVIRYSREKRKRTEHPLVVYFDSVSQAAEQVKAEKGAVLILSGVQTLGELKTVWKGRTNCYARILPRGASVAAAKAQGFPSRKLIKEMPPSDAEAEKLLFKKLNIKAVITKESGNPGGQDAKITAAIETGAKVAVIKRPENPVFETTVFSEKEMVKKTGYLLNVS